MTHCKHCGSHEDKYVMLYEKGNDQPAQIDLWTIHEGEHICVGSITTIDTPEDVKLKPIFFCANCNAVLPEQFMMEAHSTRIASHGLGENSIFLVRNT